MKQTSLSDYIYDTHDEESILKTKSLKKMLQKKFPANKFTRFNQEIFVSLDFSGNEIDYSLYVTNYLIFFGKEMSGALLASRDFFVFKCRDQYGNWYEGNRFSSIDIQPLTTRNHLAMDFTKECCFMKVLNINEMLNQSFIVSDYDYFYNMIS